MSRLHPHIPKPRNRTHPKTTDTPGQFGPKMSPKKKVAFLAVLATPLGTPTKAARAIGVDRRTAYNWRKDDQDFADAWDAACEEGVDALEEEARRRAYDGVLKPVAIAGVREEIVEYSDTLMSLVLRGRRQKVFGNKTEVSGPDGQPIQHEVTVTFVKAGAKK